jgi:hypothetical protein
LAQFGRFALKAVDFLNDLDRQQNFVLFETEKRIGVMEQDIGIKNVILFHEQMTSTGLGPCGRTNF